MNSLQIRDLDVEEIDLVSGGNWQQIVIGGVVGGLVDWAIKEGIDWYKSPPSPRAPDGSGIPAPVARDILDNQNKPSPAPPPVPGEETDAGG